MLILRPQVYRREPTHVGIFSHNLNPLLLTFRKQSKETPEITFCCLIKRLLPNPHTFLKSIHTQLRSTYQDDSSPIKICNLIKKGGLTSRYED